LPENGCEEHGWIKEIVTRLRVVVRQGLLLENVRSKFADTNATIPEICTNMLDWIEKKLTYLEDFGNRRLSNRKYIPDDLPDSRSAPKSRRPRGVISKMNALEISSDIGVVKKSPAVAEMFVSGGRIVKLENFPDDFSQRDVAQLFVLNGFRIYDVRVIHNNNPPFAVIDCGVESEAAEAIRKLNGAMLAQSKYVLKLSNQTG